MPPELVTLEVETARALRVLRKLLGKLSDLEEEAVLRPSLYRDIAKTAKDLPPAHPFGLLANQRMHKQPRYTYKRKRTQACHRDRCSRSESSNGLAKADDMSLVEYLSDSGVGGSRSPDPAIWLTTPRKKPRRQNSHPPHSMHARTAPSLGNIQSFVSRVETLGVGIEQKPVNTVKAEQLTEYMVQLGQQLWLAGSEPDEAIGSVRCLPLQVMAAFRSGIAIAQSDGSEDIEYLKEIYGCVPAYLARFVLWQHAVSLCFLRAPSYANALSAALYKVGAFFQQDWLVSVRLEQMDSIGALVRTGTIALLHLWSVDIGTEARFFDKYVALLLPHTNGRRGGDSFWQQFVPASMLQDTRAYRKAVRGNDSGTDDDVSGSQTGTRISRYAKWVARVREPRESVRILSLALRDAAKFIAKQIRSGASDSSQVDAAQEALGIICPVIYARVGCETLLGDTRRIPGELLRGISAMDSLVQAATEHVASSQKSRAKIGKYRNSDTGASIQMHLLLETCLQHHTCLCLVAVCVLRRRDEEEGPWMSRHPRLATIVQTMLAALCATHLPHRETASSPTTSASAASDRARLISCAQSSIDRSSVLMSLDDRVLARVVQPLAVSGVDPHIFSGMVLAVADDLGEARVAGAIAALVQERFEVMWRHHLECAERQAGWNAVQSAINGGGAAACLDGSVATVAAGAAVNGEGPDQVRSELARFAARLRRPVVAAREPMAEKVRQDRRPRPCVVDSEEPAEEDELGALLSRRRALIRSKGG